MGLPRERRLAAEQPESAEGFKGKSVTLRTLRSLRLVMLLLAVMLAFEGDSQVVWFEGNYQDYEADRKRRLGAAAEQPHRIKYRKLTR